MIPDTHHAFDTWVETESEIDERILKPAVSGLRLALQRGQLVFTRRKNLQN